MRTWKQRLALPILRLVPDLWQHEYLTAKVAVLHSGHWRSVKESQPVDIDGLAIPWYTYSAIAYLDRLSFEGLSVFEWGCGNSTRYWERRGASVTAVDDSPEWFARISTLVERADLTLATDSGGYVNAIGDDIYDIVCIDGQWRNECATRASARVADGGLIVFDNSDRHPEALRLLRNDGWTQIDFAGLGPLNSYEWTTSVLMRAASRIAHPDLPPASY